MLRCCLDESHVEFTTTSPRSFLTSSVRILNYFMEVDLECPVFELSFCGFPQISGLSMEHSLACYEFSFNLSVILALISLL